MRAVPRSSVALNSAILVELDAPVDPLSVTARAVAVRGEDGRPLEARVACRAGNVSVELLVTPELLGAPPARLVVELVGLPSVHALRTADGRYLARRVELVLDLEGVLERTGQGPARLVSVDGRRLPLAGPLDTRGVLVLGFDGVLDPSTLVPESCPLYPLEQGLTLPTAIHPGVEWRCIGGSTELRLDLGGATGSMQLDLRRFGVRDLSGAAPEPPLLVELRAS